MTRRFILLALALAVQGCAYQYPYTAPTPVPVAETRAPARAARFEIRPEVDPSGRNVTLVLNLWDEFGALSPELDATCTATSGVVNPQRIVGKGSALAQWSNALPLPGSVTCNTNGFDRPAVATVDLSAWSIRFNGFTEQLDERLTWRTLATFTQFARSTFPATARSIEWGDGRTEIVDGQFPSSTGVQTVSHVYPGAGVYTVRARIEWEHGGAAENRVMITRTCQQYVGPEPIPTPSVSYGVCSNTFREIR